MKPVIITGRPKCQKGINVYVYNAHNNSNNCSANQRADVHKFHITTHTYVHTYTYVVAGNLRPMKEQQQFEKPENTLDTTQ